MKELSVYLFIAIIALSLVGCMGSKGERTYVESLLPILPHGTKAIVYVHTRQLVEKEFPKELMNLLDKEGKMVAGLTLGYKRLPDIAIAFEEIRGEGDQGILIFLNLNKEQLNELNEYKTLLFEKSREINGKQVYTIRKKIGKESMHYVQISPDIALIASISQIENLLKDDNKLTTEEISLFKNQLKTINTSKPFAWGIGNSGPNMSGKLSQLSSISNKVRDFTFVVYVTSGIDLNARLSFNSEKEADELDQGFRFILGIMAMLGSQNQGLTNMVKGTEFIRKGSIINVKIKWLKQDIIDLLKNSPKPLI